MTSPRHLWSGDWERESAAAAQQLPPPRAQIEPRPEPEPPQPRRAPRRRIGSLPGAVRLRLARAGARTRVALATAALTLLSAVAAFAIVAALSGSGGNGRGEPWLGVDLASSPIVAGGFQSGFGAFKFTEGAEVTGVVAGGPAAAAGIQPGDVILQVGQQAVSSPAAVQLAIADMHVGDQVEVRYEVGPVTRSTLVTLKARPARAR